jgi:Na+/melibiose symporter-like transporter
MPLRGTAGGAQAVAPSGLPASSTIAPEATSSASSSGAGSARHVVPTAGHTLAYGLFALPLAFAALPLYVQWPAHAAAAWALPLGAIGLLLLAVRVLDAFVDPWLGARADRLFARSARGAWLAAGLGAAAVAAGVAALFFVPAALRASPAALLGWSALALVVTSLGYSLAVVTHQAWAVRLGGAAAEQARWVGTREALALAGVLVASVLPAAAGWGVTVLVLAGLLGLGWLVLAKVPPHEAGAAAQPSVRAVESVEAVEAAEPVGEPKALEAKGAMVARAPLNTAAVADDPVASAAGPTPPRSPWHDPGFRRLMAIVLASGMASAIPASLVLFYVRDVLQAAGAAEGWTLGLYFAAAALGMPLWVRAVRRFGLVRPWLASMVIAILSFAGAATLGAGDLPLFAVICLASGLALGADLVVPAALLAGLIRRRDSRAHAHAHAPTHAQADAQAQAQDPGMLTTGAPPAGGHGAHGVGVEGLWFGWWNFTAKLTLAAAAGLALPLVQWLGYAPGVRDSASLTALAICYALLPCAVKALAAVLLWWHRSALPDPAPLGQRPAAEAPASA